LDLGHLVGKGPETDTKQRRLRKNGLAWAVYRGDKKVEFSRALERISLHLFASFPKTALKTAFV
jgi:hypothetical protein